jgi:hypothetical protein
MNNDLYNDLLNSAKSIGLPLKKILDFLYLIKNGDKINNNLLLVQLGVSKNVLNQVKKQLSDLLEPVSQDTQLKNNVISNVQELFNDNYLMENSLWSFLEDTKYSENIKLLKKYSPEKPNPKRNYDQFFALPETVAKRAALMDFLGDIKNKKILFLGDDDYTALTVAAYRQASNITVMDIDSDIIDKIKSISLKENLDIQIINHDVRLPIPQNLLDKFDIVFTDPPYSQNGINLFLSRGVHVLNPENSSARIYLCFGNSDRAKERFLPIYDTIIKSGLMIRFIFDKFNSYEGAESIGGSSSLFICDVTPKTKPLIKGEFKDGIYTNT